MKITIYWKQKLKNMPTKTDLKNFNKDLKVYKLLNQFGKKK